MKYLKTYDDGISIKAELEKQGKTFDDLENETGILKKELIKIDNGRIVSLKTAEFIKFYLNV